MHNPPTHMRTAFCTVLALAAFAANSILCRLALQGPAIDAASFTTVRLFSGALVLYVFSSLTSRWSSPGPQGSWSAASLLFLYAAAFSFAYLSLSAGTGALILFAAVQLTMILAALLTGERPARLEWMGLVAALTGLVYLVSPGLSAPSPAGSVLMGLAGISWGLYSLLGKAVQDPIRVTTGNFARAVPFTFLASAVTFRSLELSGRGVLLAVVSGALTSGLGYVIWYAALPGLSATRAATVQLSVPVLAAVGGVLFLFEPVKFRLLSSATLILGGIGLSLLGKQERRTNVRRKPAF